MIVPTTRHLPVTQQMTWRARAYMMIMALRHLGVGGFCLLGPDQFTSDAYHVIRQLLPLQAWGVLLLAIGVNALLSIIYENEWWARLTLTASVTATVAWGAAFLAAGVQGRLGSPIGPIIWLVLALKDLVVAAMPLRSPFEDLVSERHRDLSAP